MDAIFISKNDRLYRPPYAREPNTTAYNNYIPYFICSVSMHSSSALENREACERYFAKGIICQAITSAGRAVEDQQAELKVWRV